MSLLEVVIATLLMSAAVAAAYDSLISSRTGLMASMEEVTATAQAAATLEAIKHVPFDDLPVSVDGEPAPDSAWNDQRFCWPPDLSDGARAASHARSPSAALASLGPLPSVPGMQRFLTISLVPAVPKDSEPRRVLKMVEVRVTWARPQSADAASESVSLCTLLEPPAAP